MKIRYIILIGLLSSRIYAIEDKMIDSLKRIDTDRVRKLLIPGFFTGPEEKERYLQVAKEMTNRTHQELQSLSGWDIIRLGKGLSQLALGGAAAAAAYFYYKRQWDISLWSIEPDKTRKIKAQDLTDVHHRYGVYAVLGCMSWYMLSEAMGQFSAIIDKKDRLDNHRCALQNEAVIQRIPVIDQTPCDQRPSDHMIGGRRGGG